MKKPVAKDYQTNDGMHAAMREWAKTQNKPTLRVQCQWTDSPDWYIDTFEPLTKEVEYKTPDGEVYTQTVDVAKYEPCDLTEGLTAGKLRKHVNNWLISADPDVKVVKTIWS